MKATNIKQAIGTTRRLLASLFALALLLTAAAQAATPGITGPSFDLRAEAAFISQPDGAMVYSWGYGCNTAPAGFAPRPNGVDLPNANCPTMQIPGPTLIVTQGQTVTVKLTNNLPAAAGNTSILFPGFAVTSSGGVPGLLTQEAAPGASVVLPSAIPSACTSGLAAKNAQSASFHGEADFRLAAAAYNHVKACYDREYLFQFSEMDPRIHNEALAQVTAKAGCAAGAPECALAVATEPYIPAYFMVNGRSMPDDMDSNYAYQYSHQPYNGNPHMHPGEQVLLRIVGQGRWQHPFHEHGNHVRVLARDGNLILSDTDPANNL